MELSASSTSFITVTVSNTIGDNEPGDNDVSIPTVLATLIRSKGSSAPSFSNLQQKYYTHASQLFAKAQSIAMGADDGPWWSAPISPDEMSYECDAGLGVPREVDCAKLQYTQLTGAIDSINLGPGASKVLQSGKESDSYPGKLDFHLISLLTDLVRYL